MKTVYAVSTMPIRDRRARIVGWVRADPVADGAAPTDTIFLRDGSAYGQAEAMERIQRDAGLVYPSREEAVRDGLARLRAADEGRR